MSTGTDDSNLLSYRVGRLEEMMQKVIENQAILTRMEVAYIDTARTLTELKQRLDAHGKVLDAIVVEQATIKANQSIQSWGLKIIVGTLLTAAVSAAFIFKTLP